jgi:hypothetical protein
MTGVLAQNWSRYRTGKRDVGYSTLKRVGQKMPGSLIVYNIGPERAPLWSALWSFNEQELWDIVKSISGKIQFYKACNTEEDNVCDYTRLESTGIYFEALSEYYEENVSSGERLINMEDLAALVAAFRLGQFRRDAANYQGSLGSCLERSITARSQTTRILRGYGLLDYVSNYVNKLIPRADINIQEIPLISRESSIDRYNPSRSTPSEKESLRREIMRAIK